MSGLHPLGERQRVQLHYTLVRSSFAVATTQGGRTDGQPTTGKTIQNESRILALLGAVAALLLTFAAPAPAAAAAERLREALEQHVTTSCSSA